MIVNPGNILPIYDNIRDQWRFRWGHTDFGIVADVETLLPFQLKVDGGQVLESWQLVSADGTGVWDLDIDNFDRATDSDGLYKWYTWFGTAPVGQELGCGLFFMRFSTGRREYFSEVVRLESLGGYENAGLSASCSDNEVSLGAYDSLGTAIVSQVIQQLDDDGVTWNTVGSNSYTVPNDTLGPTETYQFRRVVRTAGGTYLTTYYTLFFEVGDACATYLLIPYNVDNWAPAQNRAKITFKNDIDTADVIYSTGYEQWAYLDAHMDYPEVVVENETQIDGNGREQILASNVKERIVFEFPRVPDFWLSVFSYLPKMTTKTIAYDELEDTNDMNEAEFAFRKQEEGYYSVGRLSYRKHQFFDGSCDPPYTLSTPEE